MKKVILCVAMLTLVVSCNKKDDLDIEIQRLDHKRAIYELRLSKLEYIKTLVFLKNSEAGTPSEKFVDSLLNQERKFLIEK
jgi:hypothetical protein